MKQPTESKRLTPTSWFIYMGGAHKSFQPACKKDTHLENTGGLSTLTI